MAASRRLTATTRRTYRAYLLGGVAYRAGCGHRLRIHSRTKVGARVVCNVAGDGTGHGEYRSWGGAEAFVDRLFAALNLDDPVLISAIEEIALVTGSAQTTRSHRAPRPEATDLKNAIAALGNSSSDIRAVMESRLNELQAGPPTVVHPAPPVGSIAERLASWSEAWTESDTKAKNDLLKAAGVQVLIGWNPSPEHRRHVSHVAEIRVEEPAIGAALLEAQRRALTSRGPGGLERRDVTRLKVVAPMSVVKAFARLDRHDSRGEAA